MADRLHGATLFPLVLAGLLAGLTYWLDMASRSPATGDGKQRHDPDTVIDHFEVRRFGPDGALQHTLRARQLRHYPADDKSLVLAPDLTYHRAPPTRVTAREARIDGDGKRVELVEDVRIARGATRGKPETVLTTSRLEVWPDDEIAANREPVLIVQGESQVRGVGMHADNRTGEYVLDGPVRGIFHRVRNR